MNGNQVQDATAALKGMLGLNSTSNSISSNQSNSAGNNIAPNDSSENFIPVTYKNKKTPTRRKKSGAAAAAPPPLPPPPLIEKDDQVGDATAALKSMLGLNIGELNDTTTTSVTAVNKKKKKAPKKKKKKKESNANTNDNINSNPNGTPKNSNKGGPVDNFAWSAFQSPPDASSLPLPTFASSAVRPAVPFNSRLIGAFPPPPDVITQPSLQPQHASPSAKVQADPVPQRTPPVSSSGINLAALASYPI